MAARARNGTRPPSRCGVEFSNGRGVSLGLGCGCNPLPISLPPPFCLSRSVHHIPSFYFFSLGAFQWESRHSPCLAAHRYTINSQSWRWFCCPLLGPVPHHPAPLSLSLSLCVMLSIFLTPPSPELPNIMFTVVCGPRTLVLHAFAPVEASSEAEELRAVNAELSSEVERLESENARLVAAEVRACRPLLYLHGFLP